VNGIETRQHSSRNRIDECEWKVDIIEHTPIVPESEADDDSLSLGTDSDSESEGRRSNPPLFEKLINNTAVFPSSFWRNAFIHTWKATFDSGARENPYFPSPISKETQRRRIGELRSIIRDAENALAREEKLKSVIDRDVPMEFLGLYGEEFTLGDFKLSFLVDLAQGSTSLGKLKGFMDGILRYDGGGWSRTSRCTKATDLRLICSNVSQLISVYEYGTCEYKALFATPLECRRTDIAELENMPLGELNAIWEKTAPHQPTNYTAV
jgi:hypothetical protein